MARSISSFRQDALWAGRLRALRVALRSGSWLTPERLRIYPALIGGALTLALVAVLVTSHGATDRWHRPLGVDFSGVWVAGEAVRAGHPAQPYDNAAHAAAQTAAFGASESFLPWGYPPYLLAIAGTLAGLTYLVALAVWQGGTLLLYIAGVLGLTRGAALARRDVLIGALAFPAVAINLFHGQNGFLSAGLLALGATQLPRRPVIAGIFLAMLAYKPQFALALPVVLLAGRYWRATAACAISVVAMTLATWLAYGPAPWQAFFGSLAFSRHVILESGGLESWKLQSAFAAVRLLGGSLSLAYLAQGIIGAAALIGLVTIWRGHADHRLKVAALMVASLLISPYVVDYDMAMLGPALAALVAFGLERGFAPWEKSLFAAAWIMPLIARVAAMSIGLPIGVLILVALYAAIFARSRQAIAKDDPDPVAMSAASLSAKTLGATRGRG